MNNVTNKEAKCDILDQGKQGLDLEWGKNECLTVRSLFAIFGIEDTSDMSLGIKKSELFEWSGFVIYVASEFVEWSKFIMDAIHVIEFREMVLCVLSVAR
ncbi:RNA-directed RNA polymerase L [Gossypium arboreum]|uniref:RNA-directed RNA polymerase L n=1 Tax=Gossypium arboreum TaxID=29729 RepID=A0A0B0PEK6_GOSAR|nr:RNA-directed RNA polymerase L [Gossypium arboreum]